MWAEHQELITEHFLPIKKLDIQPRELNNRVLNFKQTCDLNLNEKKNTLKPFKPKQFAP